MKMVDLAYLYPSTKQFLDDMPVIQSQWQFPNREDRKSSTGRMKILKIPVEPNLEMFCDVLPAIGSSIQRAISELLKTLQTGQAYKNRLKHSLTCK